MTKDQAAELKRLAVQMSNATYHTAPHYIDVKKKVFDYIDSLTQQPAELTDAATLATAFRVAMEAVVTCTTGGYTDIDRDFVKTFWFDEAKVEAAKNHARAVIAAHKAKGVKV